MWHVETTASSPAWPSPSHGPPSVVHARRWPWRAVAMSRRRASRTRTACWAEPSVRSDGCGSPRAARPRAPRAGRVATSPHQARLADRERGRVERGRRRDRRTGQPPHRDGERLIGQRAVELADRGARGPSRARSVCAARRACPMNVSAPGSASDTTYAARGSQAAPHRPRPATTVDRVGRRASATLRATRSRAVPTRASRQLHDVDRLHRSSRCARGASRRRARARRCPRPRGAVLHDERPERAPQHRAPRCDRRASRSAAGRAAGSSSTITSRAATRRSSRSIARHDHEHGGSTTNKLRHRSQPIAQRHRLAAARARSARTPGSDRRRSPRAPGSRAPPARRTSPGPQPTSSRRRRAGEARSRRGAGRRGPRKPGAPPWRSAARWPPRTGAGRGPGRAAR